MLYKVLDIMMDQWPRKEKFISFFCGTNTFGFNVQNRKENSQRT